MPDLECYQQTKHNDQTLFVVGKGWRLFGVILWLCVCVCICIGVYFYLSKVTASLIFCISSLSSTQIGVTAALLTTIVGVISVNQTWGQEWDVIPISLQVSRLNQSKTQATFDGLCQLMPSLSAKRL